MVLMSDQKKSKSVYLILDKELFHGLIIKYELSLNENEPRKGSIIGTQWRFVDGNSDSYGARINMDDIIKDKIKTNSCKGWFEIEFKPNTQIERKIELKNLLYEDTFGSHEKIQIS